MSQPQAPASEEVPATARSVTVAAVVVVLLAGFLVPVPTFGPEARTLPLVVGVPSLLLGIASLVREVRRFRTTQRRAVMDEPPAATEAPGHGRANRTSLAAAMAWVLAGTALIVVFGFLIGAVLFIPAFMRLYGHESLIRIMLVTGGVVGVIYVVFIRLLEVSYYPGLWG